MATNVDIAKTDITASQLSEFFRLVALPDSHINRENLQWFLEQKLSYISKDVEEMIRLVGIMDMIRSESGINKEELRALWTSEGQIHIKRMFESLRRQLDICQFTLVETDILKPEGTIVFPARDEPINPYQFSSRPNVHLSDSFRQHILPALKPVTSTLKRIYGVGRLKKRASGREILSDLPERHLGHWEDIASLTEMYPNGKAGYYLVYLEGVGGGIFVVGVHWDSGDRCWAVDGWRLDARGEWLVGSQVLCPVDAIL